VQLRHDVLADPVVDHALAFEDGLLRGVEGGGVVLEVLDQCPGFRTFVEDLGLALVDLLTAGHLFAFSVARCFPKSAERKTRAVWSRPRSDSDSRPIPGV